MPELPEVETIVRRYRPLLRGRRVCGYRSLWARNSTPSPARLRRAIAGGRITRVHRRGKFIVLDLDNAGHVLMHLRMSGRLEWSGDGSRRPQHTRAIFSLDGGEELWFVDARKFGRIVFTRDLAAATAGLGVEPLSRRFTPAALGRLLSSRSRMLKPLLLDQSIIAGLGNIYVDESLFAAGLHPLMRSDQLSNDEIARLHAAIRSTLTKAIRHNGTSIDWIYPSGQMQDYLCVYGRTGEPCPRCGRPIERLVVAQRGTHVCPACQPCGRRTKGRSGVSPDSVGCCTKGGSGVPSCSVQDRSGLSPCNFKGGSGVSPDSGRARARAATGKGSRFRVRGSGVREKGGGNRQRGARDRV